MPAGGLIIAGAGLAYGAINGAIQNHKANQLQKSLKDPNYVIPPEFYQNREIARQMAELGIPTQAYNNAENNINQTQAASIAAAQRSNNPAAAISTITRQSDQAKARLDAEDAQARETNQRYFIGENSQIAAQKLQKQQNDVYDKFTRDFNQMQAYRGAAQQNINNAVSGAQQLGETYLQYKNPSTPAVQSNLPAGTAQKMQVPAYMWDGSSGNPANINKYNPGVQWNGEVNYDWPVPYGGGQ